MRILNRFGLAVIIGVLLTGARSAGSAQASEEFRIDAAASNVLVRVGRAGLFGFVGHDHEVAVPAFTGRVTLDRTDISRSSVSVEFDATRMTVTGKGEPAKDVPEVQRVMLSERVLDVQRHPKIAFVSRGITLGERSADRIVLRVSGQLTLRGTTQTVNVPVEVRLSADRLTASGSAAVRQTLFGIQPVTAGAGTVKVKDEVEVVFTLVARRN